MTPALSDDKLSHPCVDDAASAVAEMEKHRMECLYQIDDGRRSHDQELLERIVAQIGSRKRDTVGILVWNKVFIHKMANGEELAVILMDTQGTFDLQSENDESINYFATSLLLSSVQIFNVCQKLDSTDFEALSTFIDYGERTGNHLSQHFLFLIRDAISGSGLSPEFLQRLLAGSSKAQRLYKLITGCLEAFEKVESFLVPRPDNRLAQADAEILAGECGAEFLQAISAAAGHVLRSLQPKRAMGVPLDGPGFGKYAQEYATFSTVPPDEYARIAETILGQAQEAYLAVQRYGQTKSLAAHLRDFCEGLQEKNSDKCAANKEIYKHERINGAVADALRVYQKHIQPGLSQLEHQQSRHEVQALHSAAQRAAIDFYEKETALFLADSYTVIMQNKEKLVQLLEEKLEDQLRSNSQHWVAIRSAEIIDARIEDFSLLLQEKSKTVQSQQELEEALAECYAKVEKDLEVEQQAMIDQLLEAQPEQDPQLVASQIQSNRERRLNRSLKAMESEFIRNATTTLDMKRMAAEMDRQKQEHTREAQQIQEEMKRKLAEAEHLLKKNSDDEKSASMKQFERDTAARKRDLEKKELEQKTQMEASMRKLQAEMEKQAIDRELMKKEQEGMRAKYEQRIGKLEKEKERVRLQMENTEPAIGIDLGTTYSAVGMCVGDEVVIIADEHGKTTMASQVAFHDEKVLVGESAKVQATRNSGNTIYEAKRAMGRLYKDPALEKCLKLWEFKVIEQAGEPAFQVEHSDKRVYTPVDISEKILTELKNRASAYIGKPVKKAVITVPAYFNDAQRAATKEAAEKAGLEVIQLLNEPTAAAIAFGLAQHSEKKRNILVYDFGGGTFDVSIMEVYGSEMTVKSTCGNPHLGGEDINKVLLEYCIEDGNLGTLDGRASSRLRLACETAKIQLSKEKEAVIDVPVLANQKDYTKTMSRDFYDELCKTLFEKTLLPVEHALEDSGLKASQIDEVVLVGGSSYIPKVRSMLQEKFNFASLNTAINPEEAVVAGAALQAAKAVGNQFERVKNIKFTDVIPLTIGVGIIRDRVVVLIPRNTAYPVKKTESLTNPYDYQKECHIQVYEGESKTFSKNTTLGSFTIPLAPVPANQAKISVTYEIDQNGTLRATAEDLATGKHGEVTIEREKYGKATIFDVENYLADKSQWKATSD
ncbi:unnamed protein product, partial [Mesorhabditis spiculigera]